MIRRTLRIAAIAIVSGALSISAFAQGKTHRVVFALASPEQADWRLTLNNLQNLVHGFASEPYDIEVVAYGPGIAFLKKDDADAAEIQKLESAHLHFVACETAMRKQNVTAADLIEGVTTTPSGIVEVVRRQEQGWTYIKAGR